MSFAPTWDRNEETCRWMVFFGNSEGSIIILHFSHRFPWSLVMFVILSQPKLVGGVTTASLSSALRPLELWTGRITRRTKPPCQVFTASISAFWHWESWVAVSGVAITWVRDYIASLGYLPLLVFALHGPRNLHVVLPSSPATKHPVTYRIPSSPHNIFLWLVLPLPNKTEMDFLFIYVAFSSCTQQCMHSGTATAYGVWHWIDYLFSFLFYPVSSFSSAHIITISPLLINHVEILKTPLSSGSPIHSKVLVIP